MDEQNFQNDYQSSYTNEVIDSAATVEPAKKETSALAVVSLVMGILAIVLGCCSGFFGIIFGIVGIVCSVLDKKKGKSGLATAGLVCSIIGIIIAIIMTVFSVGIYMTMLPEMLEAYGY